MDTTLIAVIGIIVLLILATGILWVMNAKSGSYSWKVKTHLFEANSHVEGEQRPDIEQIQRSGEGNSQITSKEAKSHQEQIDGVKNKQEIK